MPKQGFSDCNTLAIVTLSERHPNSFNNVFSSVLYAEARKINCLLLPFSLPYYFPPSQESEQSMAFNFLLIFSKRNASISDFLPSDTTPLLMSLQGDNN